MMIAGGLTQAAGVLQASGKYGHITLQEPYGGLGYRWEIRGQGLNGGFSPLTVCITGNPDDGSTVIWIAGHKIGKSFDEAKTAYETILLGEFSEQWFREKVRARVRDLVS